MPSLSLLPPPPTLGKKAKEEKSTPVPLGSDWEWLADSPQKRPQDPNSKGCCKSGWRLIYRAMELCKRLQDCKDRRYCGALGWHLCRAAWQIGVRKRRELSTGQKGGLGRAFWEPQNWSSKGRQRSGLRCFASIAQRPRTTITGGEAGHWHWQGCMGESCAVEPALL